MLYVDYYVRTAKRAFFQAGASVLYSGLYVLSRCMYWLLLYFTPSVWLEVCCHGQCSCASSVSPHNAFSFCSCTMSVMLGGLPGLCHGPQPHSASFSLYRIALPLTRSLWPWEWPRPLRYFAPLGLLNRQCPASILCAVHTRV